MKRMIMFSSLLVFLLNLAACEKFEMLPGTLNIHDGKSLQSEERVDLASKEKARSYHEGSYLYVDQESFISRFNSVSNHEIEHVEFLNGRNNIVFQIDSNEIDSEMFLIAENNPVENKLLNVKLIFDKESDLKDSDYLFLEDLLNSISVGLEMQKGIQLELKDYQINSFTHEDFDVYSDWSREGLLVAFHPKGTFSNYETFKIAG